MGINHINRAVVPSLSDDELVDICQILKTDDDMNHYEFLIMSLRKRLEISNDTLAALREDIGDLRKKIKGKQQAI